MCGGFVKRLVASNKLKETCTSERALLGCFRIFSGPASGAKEAPICISAVVRFGIILQRHATMPFEQSITPDGAIRDHKAHHTTPAMHPFCRAERKLPAHSETILEQIAPLDALNSILGLWTSRDYAVSAFKRMQRPADCTRAPVRQ